MRAGKVDNTHCRDLGYALAFLIGSFALDFMCVRYFSPFDALLIGDAIMNAVVHANGGVAEIRADRDRFQVSIEDNGPGIQLDRLPRATLEKGYSTAGSLGHGFWIILPTIDRLDILTGSDGTRMVLTFDRVRPPREFSFLQ